ncbi:MAG TPA: hypothetical protein P5060_02310 [Candidatus Absconditabacterales bacterium]|nr:hypothetical protein [Candidatus Absconditabacterales bacterium]
MIDKEIIKNEEDNGNVVDTDNVEDQRLSDDQARRISEALKKIEERTKKGEESGSEKK